MKYDLVPKIITSKDLDYLKDMFNWNYGAYKSMENAKSSINDVDIKCLIEKGSKLFYDTMVEVLSILGGANE